MVAYLCLSHQKIPKMLKLEYYEKQCLFLGMIIFLTYQRILNIAQKLKDIVLIDNLLEEVHEKQNQ